jgi:Cu/Ag efflux protein CusF
MNRLLLLFALCVCSSAFAQYGSGAPESKVIAASEPGKASMARVTKATATIESIDLAQRHITLKRADGQLFSMTVDPAVKLERLKVGDKVVVGYLEALSLTLMKEGKEPPVRQESAGASRSGAGEPPGATVARRIEATADVIAVNEKTQTVTLRGPNQVVDLKVPDPQQFKRVKVGDQVHAVYTEAVAVEVEPAAAGSKK